MIGVIKSRKGNEVEISSNPTAEFREPQDFQQPMRCMHHLNLIIAIALLDWLIRMCDPQGVIMSADEVLGSGAGAYET